LGLISLKKR